MPWQQKFRTPEKDSCDQVLVCTDKESPAGMIILNQNEDIINIYFEKFFINGLPQSPQAIEAIKDLKPPCQITDSGIFVECKITQYSENLDKIIKCLDPENALGLTPLLNKLAVTRSKPILKISTLKPALCKFNNQVEIFKSEQETCALNQDEEEKLKQPISTKIKSSRKHKIHE